MRTYVFDKVAVERGTWDPQVLQEKALKIEAENLHAAFTQVMARKDWMAILPNGRCVRYHLRRVK